MDLGYTNFCNFADLTARQITFLTRAKTNLSCEVERVLHSSANVHDARVWIGPSDQRQVVRLIAVLYHGLWYRYLTNELDPQCLPPQIAVALYRQRWRVEDAYASVKRLLGLAYFWSGFLECCSTATVGHLDFVRCLGRPDGLPWAEQLHQPFGALSLEMVYRGLFPFHLCPYQRQKPLMWSPSSPTMPTGSVCSSANASPSAPLPPTMPLTDSSVSLTCD